MGEVEMVGVRDHESVPVKDVLADTLVHGDGISEPVPDGLGDLLMLLVRLAVGLGVAHRHCMVSRTSPLRCPPTCGSNRQAHSQRAAMKPQL